MVDGKAVAEGRVEKTQANIFSADETADVGIDNQTPVALGIGIRQLRRETEQRGLARNVWFNNVERIASERLGRETVTYVSTIDKYYITYRLVTDQMNRREAAKAEVGKRQ